MTDAAALPTTAILFVCTGNVCRSPYMEYSLRAMLQNRGPAGLSISSAGTRALEGHVLAGPMTQRLHDRGIDAGGFRASGLRREMLDAAEIVVTATREHRRQVVQYLHEAAERTFTLAQLARLLSAAPLGAPVFGSVTDMVAAAHATRGRTAMGAGDDDDLEDPWHQSRRTYRRVAERIDELLIPMAARLIT